MLRSLVGLGDVYKRQYPGLSHGAYRANRSSGYGYECPTELTEVPGTGMKVLQNFQKYRALWHGPTELGVGIKMLYPYPGYLWYERTELTEVPGSGIFVVSYRTYRSSGYGYECPTELTEVLCRVIPGANTPGMVLYVPYRRQPCKVQQNLSCIYLVHKCTWYYVYMCIICLLYTSPSPRYS